MEFKRLFDGEKGWVSLWFCFLLFLNPLLLALRSCREYCISHQHQHPSSRGLCIKLISLGPCKNRDDTAARINFTLLFRNARPTTFALIMLHRAAGQKIYGPSIRLDGNWQPCPLANRPCESKHSAGKKDTLLCKINSDAMLFCK